MSQQYTGTFKLCATCTYWLGPRSFTDCYQRRIVVPGKGAMEKGGCANTASPNYWTARNFGFQANWCCRCYELWPAIKV